MQAPILDFEFTAETPASRECVEVLRHASEPLAWGSGSIHWPRCRCVVQKNVESTPSSRAKNFNRMAARLHWGSPTAIVICPV